MTMRSHVDPCTFVLYMHISGEHLLEPLRERLKDFKSEQGASSKPILDCLPPRSHQVHFHEAYHFWQGLRLPFLYRYAFLSFRQMFMAFVTMAKHETNFARWNCILPEFERLGHHDWIGIVDPGHLLLVRDLAKLPATVSYKIQLTPLGLLECATSMAEFQVSTQGDKSEPNLFDRWVKRNPAYIEPYVFATRFLGDRALALRAILPLINAAFHTSDPVRSFCELLGRTWGAFAPGKKFRTVFLAQPEPCRWTELFERWLGHLPYEAEVDIDSKILGSPYHRITLNTWVNAKFTGGGRDFVTHPFLGPLARKWAEVERAKPEYGLLMDHPAWASQETFSECRNEFSPPFSVLRFHLGNDADRVFLIGKTSGQTEFTSLPIDSANGFIADALTIYGAVRRASGAHFNAEQRVCYHEKCPHYSANFCNTYPIIPDDFHDCGFSNRIQRLIEIFRR